jgi:DNA (cytosine-5)-methyltransferase 1
VHHVLASDCGADQRQTFTTNFRPDIFLSVPIERVINGRLGARLTASERKVRKQVGSLTLTTGGPPCQGHSNLNNHTRRNDPKNALYARMARFAEALEPESLVIENVPGVLRDRSGVFGTTVDHLLGLGYSVDHRLIRMEQIGVPQRRHRVIVLATKRRRGAAAVLQSLEENFATPSRPVGWAISDLIGANPGDPLNQPSASNSMNQRRIDWLFDNNAHDLPDRLRPACHRLKEHTYGAVYGRLYWDQPAWTITTGFQSMGQGRFVHPLERRVLTPHEAARLQFMPDFMRFVYSSRASLATMIGNAVPPRLAYALALELLR